MIVPILAGLYRYKELDYSYKVLFYSTCLTLLNQILYLLFREIPGYKLSPLWNNIFNYMTVLCWLPLYVFIVFSWLRIRKSTLFSMIFLLVYILSILTEGYYVGLDTFRTSPAILFSKLLSTLIFVFCLNHILNQKIIRKHRWSKQLLIIPHIIENIYIICLDLFMYFFYSDATKTMFQELYSSLMFIGAIALLCTALSIAWAPKKEVFI